MGMFDQKRYLTGPSGLYSKGDKFLLHNAKLAGIVHVNGKQLQEVKLKVGTPDGGTEIVYTTGKAIVGQVERMDEEDRAGMPFTVELDTIDTGKGNPAFILKLEGADAPPIPDEGEVTF